VLSLITILITVISFCSTSIKDDREELVNYCHQTQDFSTSNILEADYYNTYVNGNHYVFNEDDSLDMSKHTNVILNEQVKDYYCNSIIHIDAIELFNNIDKLSCNQYFNTKDTVDLKYDEVELELYNIKDVDVNRYIGKNIESKYLILSNFKFVVKNIVTFSDDTYDRIIIKVSNEFKNYLEDNYISLNFKLYNGYIDNSNITKDNIFKYQTLKDHFDDEYIKYKVYRGSIIFNAFLIIISGVSIYITYYGIYKNMVHSKTILESLGANKYIIYSFFGFFCLIYFVMLIIGISIFIINNSFINQRISEILKVDIETIKFNYIILIEIIFSFVISIIISLKKYSIFRIEKIN
jgi:hypothetical protein